MKVGSPEHRRYIREWYAARMAEIMAVPKNQWGIDPYEWDGVIFMSPIEELLWQDIRCNGVVLYPQFPIGPYFADFANPKAMVVVECDGKAFHSTPEQRENDRTREQELRRLGWSVWRISGKQCHVEDDEDYDKDGRMRVELSPGSRLMRMLSQEYGISMRDRRA